ncbi:von Willebrand factor type A domain protein [Janthinobacterium sp. HH103]|uniref:vWA domain-containing protein n=1 Tax=unclassified Janthinobacterium TaxID=2610881 RepID=UPI0008737B6E|nr:MULTISPECIES: VWA domain-containing protein [unclassified Janthinobacterium]OEZ66650.1 von Willebrand factor type A domain protein [Janthinobacterium sp. HH103]OEZ69596.1 von Willebrand factor type A domain protein [Janthinobacterium sp. HH100]QOU72640.1 von Willebrand factor type A domain protein [Janthinobacterium sp. HH102]
MRIPHKRQSGQVLIMVALSAVVLIASVGLAVDSALGYFVKAKLNAAVDAASLAAARGITAGNSEAEQRDSARQSAREFFDINYPDNFLLSTPVLDPVGVVFDRGTVTIDVSATASLPVSLMGVLGFKTLNVSASAQTIRKDLDMVLVMDTSRSLENNADAVRAAGKSFLNKFNSTVDRVGLLHFASEAQIDVPIRQVERGFDRDSMTMKNGKIDQFTFVGGTNSSAGMFQARKQLNDIAQVNRSSLRVIVFFSDGSPAAFSAYFPNKDNKCKDAGGLATFPKLQNPALAGLYRMKVSDSLQYGDCAASQITGLPAWYNANNDAALREFPIVTNTPRVVTSSTATAQAQWTNVHRASRNLVEAMAAKARQEGIFVFTLGMGASLKTKEGPDNELGEDLLRCLANTTDAKAACRKPAEPVGLYCYAATESELSPCFTRLASAILRISK